MKTIIAGGRDYRFTPEDYEFLERIRHTITEVVTGGATGADECGHVWANANWINTTVFHANWEDHGKAAGPLRNKDMAEFVSPDGQVILFPGGRGTDSMARCAADAKLTIIDRRTK